MNTISLICYILAGVIFVSSLVVGVRGMVRERRGRRKLPKFEMDERGEIYQIDEKGQETKITEIIKRNHSSLTLEQYLLFQILMQITHLPAKLPSRNEFYFIVGLIITLLIAIIGIIYSLGTPLWE